MCKKKIMILGFISTVVLLTMVSYGWGDGIDESKKDIVGEWSSEKERSRLEMVFKKEGLMFIRMPDFELGEETAMDMPLLKYKIDYSSDPVILDIHCFSDDGKTIIDSYSMKIKFLTKDKIQIIEDSTILTRDKYRNSTNEREKYLIGKWQGAGIKMVVYEDGTMTVQTPQIVRELLPGAFTKKYEIDYSKYPIVVKISHFGWGTLFEEWIWTIKFLSKDKIQIIESGTILMRSK